MKLVDLYRPKRFADVFGQDHAVKVLQRLILRGRIRRNLLLYGAVGSGKTTLARIYGRALQCTQLQEDGSPCYECDGCSEHVFWELDGTALTGEQLPELLERAQNKTLFIDEAQALGHGLDRILTDLEKAPPDTSVILATTDIERIPRAIRSRLFRIEFRPLSLGQSVQFLRLIASKEAIEYEPEALHLLAGDCEGQARDLLQALDQARIEGKITLQSVREQIGISFSEAAVRYLIALAEGSHQGLTQAFYEWHDPPSQKLSFIQNFLASVAFRDIHKLPVVLDSRLEAIPALTRQSIIDTWIRRIGGDVFPTYLRSLVDFWPVILPDIDEAAINLHLSRFHNRVNFVPAPKAKTQKVASTTTSVKGPKPRDDPRFLHLDDARRVINSSSKMVQEYGVLFNARIMLWHRAFGADDITSARLRTKAFNSFIRNHLQQSSWPSGYRINVAGYDEKRGYWTRIAAVVPEDRLAKLEAAVTHWKLEERLGSGATQCEIRPPEKRAFPFHQLCVRWLCGGLDPLLMVTDKSNGTARSLLHLLKVPKALREAFGDIGENNRVSRTEALNDAAFEKASNPKMAFLLPFDTGDWGEVCAPWELAEHKDRKLIKSQRAGLISEIETIFGKNATELEAELARLAETWNEDPRERERSWDPWWPTEPF